MDSTTDERFSAQTTTGYSGNEYQHSAQYKVATIALFLGCSVLLVGLNALVVVSFLFKRIPRTQPNFLMFQLAIADGATGVSLFINMFSSIFYSLSKSNSYCTFETLSSICCLMASAFCILGLTTDRLQALRDPLVYNADMTTRRYIASTLLVWLIPVSVFFFLPMIWFQDLEDTPLKICYTLYIMKREFVAYALLPASVMMYVCVSIAYIPILKMAIKQSRAIGAADLDRDQNQVKMKSQLRILKTATLVLVPYFVGWMPWCFTAAVIVYNEHEYNFPGTTFTILQYCSYPVALISGINPIIYAARMPEYRRAFRACLGCPTQVSPATLGA
ncbi:hypothetical protein CAPTEDRAFT_195579 [Capitella teleta]|uniref:G-protein coupled receptors family 1 profile domain-containing protein n=1 Tax=Capitella teleta TaxID=283909 RepID=R7UH98_CAPTE|nr:hypothetical protein CAPTEDRAFT_195579 [Capitella teleta]|eukprot:ELU03188.1 hypothetical protein CAPTEDRAFT_195579 [Capitella teleta]